MSFLAIFVKNNSGVDAPPLDDLGGIIVKNNSSIELTKRFSESAIRGSENLYDLVNAETLTINDFDKANSLAFLEPVNKKTLSDNYVSKEDLQTPNACQIDWNNIVNKPAYGSPSGWYEPVRFRVLGINLFTYPANAKSGDVIIDPDNKYKKFNGTGWDYVNDAANNDSVINLANPTQNIYIFNGTSWDEFIAALKDNWAIVVGDDGDRKSAQYIYNTAPSAWTKVNDSDFVGHLDNGTEKHTATQIKVEGTYDSIPGAPANAEMAFSGINDQLKSILDQLALTKMVDGITYAWDPVRKKWLSVTRMYLRYVHKRGAMDQYLTFAWIDPSLGNTVVRTGDRMLRDGTITGISGQRTNSNGGGLLCIRKNNTLPAVSSLQVSDTQFGNKSVACDDNFSADDYLQAYVQSIASDNTLFENIDMLIEVAWRTN